MLSSNFDGKLNHLVCNVFSQKFSKKAKQTNFMAERELLVTLRLHKIDRKWLLATEKVFHGKLNKTDFSEMYFCDKRINKTKRIVHHRHRACRFHEPLYDDLRIIDRLTPNTKMTWQ